MILFCITTVSDLLLNELLYHYNNDDVLVVTPYQNIKNSIDELGIPCILLRKKSLGIEESDAIFAEEMMPGVLSDHKFLGTDLALADVLSLDRLKFWFDYSASGNMDFIAKLNWDIAYVSLDLDSLYPFVINDFAIDDDRRCIAIRTNSIRTPEFVRGAKYLRFGEFLVDSMEDKEFLEKTVRKTKIIVREQEKSGKKEVEYPEKEELRKAMGIPSEINLIGVFFDKRTEWQCRRFIAESIDPIWVFPVDSRSIVIAESVLWQYHNRIQIKHDRKLLSACDMLVAFRWDDRYYSDLPSKLTLIDYGNINISADIAPDGVEVIV